MPRRNVSPVSPRRSPVAGNREAPIAISDTAKMLNATTKRLIRASLLVIGLGLLPAAGWVALAPLNSAVISAGVVKAGGNRRPVQHREGGIVAEVLVKDGDKVKAGDPLIVLGDVAVDADRDRMSLRLFGETATVARLDAEQSLKKKLVLPESLHKAASGDPRVADLIAKEHLLFGTRRKALTAQQVLLRKQRRRIDDELAALDQQIASLTRALGLQQQQRIDSGKLAKEGFVSSARVTRIEAALADYDARIQERRSERSRAEQRAVELRLRIRSIENEYRRQASDELKVALGRQREIEQELRKAADASKRQTVTAPVDGEVIHLHFFVPGSVVGAGEPIAEIVPANSRNIIETRVRTDDIRRVRMGQPAQVQLLAYNARAVDRVAGTVTYVGADRQVDEATNEVFYLARIATTKEALKAAGDLVMQPGMPVEAYISGDERTVLDFLLEPVTQIMRRAGRER